MFVRLEKLLQKVSEWHFWGAMRLAAATLNKLYPSVSHITAILVHGCQVTCLVVALKKLA